MQQYTSERSFALASHHFGTTLLHKLHNSKSLIKSLLDALVFFSWTWISQALLPSSFYLWVPLSNPIKLRQYLTPFNAILNPSTWIWIGLPISSLSFLTVTVNLYFTEWLTLLSVTVEPLLYGAAAWNHPSHPNLRMQSWQVNVFLVFLLLVRWAWWTPLCSFVLVNWP